MTKANHLKKLISLLMAFVLSTCMVPFAYADDTSNEITTMQEGTIIIENAVANATYDFYKVFDVTYDSVNQKYAYTINKGDVGKGRWLNFFFTLDEGTEDVNGYTKTGGKYIHEYDPDKDKATDTQALYLVTYGETYYVLDINDNNVAQFATDALDYALNDAYFEPYTSVTPKESGVFSVTGLDLGYYLVYPYGQSRYTNGGASVCALFTNAPNKTINIKSTWPSITKQISSITHTTGTVETGVGDGTVSVGDTVEFTIEFKIPDPTGYGNYTLNISDTMSEGFDYIEGSHSVYLIDSANQKQDISETFYSFNENGADEASGFTLNLNVNKIQNEKSSLIGQKIKIAYKAKVTADAITPGASNLATITYSNNPKDENSTDTSSAEVIKVYTNTLRVQKYDRDGATSEPLAGAEFYLYKLDENNKPIYYKYAQTDDGYEVQWVSDINSADKYVTKADGIVSFAGIDSGKYYLYEIKPPAGFNALSKPITVNISSQADSKGSLLIASGDSSPTAPVVSVVNLPGKGDVSEDLTALSGTTYTYLIRVGNSGGALLPSTGGAGAFVIYGISAAALVAAIVLLIRKNRRRKQSA